jgi:hypothetical protein
MYMIKVFADEMREELIFEDNILELYDDNEIDFNKFDATDWWLSKLKYIESDFGDNWRLAVFTSFDGVEGKIVSRSEYIAGKNIIPPKSFIPCALLFSPKFFGNRDTIFSENICISSKFKNANDIFNFEMPFSITHIQAMTYKYLELKYSADTFFNNFERWAHVCELLNPSEDSLFKAKICGYYPIIVIRNSSEAKDFMGDMMILKSLFSLTDINSIQINKLTNACITIDAQENAKNKIEQLVNDQFELIEEKYFY